MKTLNPQIQELKLPVVLGIAEMSPQRASIWLATARRVAYQGVTVIDPNRRPLRELRKRLVEMGITGKLYRASTGGHRFGKSSEIVSL